MNKLIKDLKNKLKKKKEKKINDFIKEYPNELKKIDNLKNELNLYTKKNKKEKQKRINKIKETINDINKKIDSLNYSKKGHKHKKFKEIKKQNNLIKNKIIEIKKTLFKEISNIKNKVVKINKEIKLLKLIKQIINHNELKNLNWSKSGHKIDIDLDLKNKKIINLKNPKENTDATNKKYVDDIVQRMNVRYGIPAGSPKTPVWYSREESDDRFVNITGDTMTGDLDMGGNNINNLKFIQSSKLITGFDYSNSNLNGDIAFADGTRTFSISVKAGQSYFNYWIRGNEYIKTSTESVVIDDTTGLHFIYFNGDTLTSSMTPWSFSDNYAFVAIIYWNSSLGEGILQEERHTNNIPRSLHEYLHDTVSMRYEFGLAGTFNDNGSFIITAGEVHDEDLKNEISQQTTCNLFYRDVSLDWEFIKTNAKFYVEDTDIIQYDNNGTLTDVPNSSFVSSYIFASNDVTNPIWVLIGQRTDTTIANAQANQTPSSLSLGDLPSPEMKLLYQVITKRTGTNETVEDVIDYRDVSSLASNGFVGIDHGGLSGLTDDDHPQYSLLAGRDGDILNIDQIKAYDGAGLKLTDDGDNGIFVKDGGNVGLGGTTTPATKLHVNGAITLTEKSSDPSDPSEGNCVLWMSDGTGTGDDGDVIMKITAGGVTKTVTIVDFSAV